MKRKPMYLYVAEELKKQIYNGDFPVDQPLPTQIEFANIFKTSEITSRRALTELVNEGLIYRVRGKGSFVKINKAEEHTNSESEVEIKRIYFVYPNCSLNLLAHPFYQELLDGINEGCEDKDVEFVTWNIGKQGKLPDDKNAGFIVLAQGQGSEEISLKMLEGWKNENKRLVSVHFYYPHLKIPYVIINNVTGGYLATQHLISQGHEKIGLILTGRSLIELNQEFSLRMQGYKLALSQHQLPFNPSYVAIAEGMQETEEMGYECMKKLLDLDDPPTAVVATSDYKAFGAIQAALDYGFKVPEDISVIGFDDIPFGKYSSPPLTTINQNSLKLGKRAVELLVDEYDKSDKEDILKDEIAPDLIVRGSTSKPLKRI
ncbi:GntR family transcriptional regulator [Bacillus sinesaloumensis]|uniref:GntR family transcriptional regulator n=1 Tax=Litchfieldia sinesaloumensis TaxID=1926280 RepID=UPI0009885532|nr:GntR family transcriptional regulator [Bacillus sinesaloumensis]